MKNIKIEDLPYPKTLKEFNETEKEIKNNIKNIIVLTKGE